MISDELRRKVARIKLAVFDVDGVLTDGRLILDNQGVETKAFHVRDGLGLKALMQHDIQVAVITARTSKVVSKRMSELGISHLLQGQDDKSRAMGGLMDQLALPASTVSYMGDDLIDWPAMRQCSVTAAPADATQWIRDRVDVVTEARGGLGAVREFCELVLAVQGHLRSWRARFE